MRRLACMLLLTAATTTGCTGGDGPDGEQASFRPVAAPAVGLPLAADLPATLRVGVVVTGAAERGQGTEFSSLAAGARVAEFRLDDGEADRVALEVVDDRGTPDGAVEAVEQLVASGVAGIVWASSGRHLDAALPAAAAARMPVLLPYDTGTSSAGATTWRTGPTEAQVADDVTALLRERGTSAPYLLRGEGYGNELVAGAAADAVLTAGEALPAQVAAAVEALRGGAADALVVAASAETSAEAVAALQAADATVPVVLGPAALSPAFAATLQERGAQGGATTAGQFFTVGPDVSDASSSDGAVAFLSALRLAAQDRSVLSLLGTGPLTGEGAATADPRSHDAVVALARAAAEAGSVAPADVLAALRGLVVDAEDGLAGPGLDFSRPAALDDDDVVVLQATTRGPARAGVDEAAPALTWFPLPGSGS